MTERLISLLHREAESLDVPAAPTSAILGSGRRLRRRRSRTVWASSALALVVAGGGAAVALTGGDGRTATPAGQATLDPAADVPFAWAAGETVYLGADARPVPMPEVAQTLYYTSAGILVRTNQDGSSDGGAPFHFELVTADGTATKLGVTLGQVVPSTDPAQPYLAWATMTDGRIQVVVHDVTTDRDVATVDVPGTFTWGGWSAPPVALSGDRVYVGTDRQTAVVNWRTGEAGTSSVLPGSQLPEVSGGRTVVVHPQGAGDATASIEDAVSGADALDIPIGRFDQVMLSPDGRFAMVTAAATGTSSELPARGGSLQVYDVDAGTRVSVAASAFDVGWTPQDALFSVYGDQLALCDTGTGACHQTTVPKTGGQGLVRYTGRVYES